MRIRPVLEMFKRGLLGYYSFLVCEPWHLNIHYKDNSPAVRFISFAEDDVLPAVSRKNIALTEYSRYGSTICSV